MPHTVTNNTIIIGCDVGKTSHQFHACDPDYNTVFRRRTPNNYQTIINIYQTAKTHGSPVLAIDQKASYAAMLRLAAATENIPVLYVTGLQARRASDLTPGRAKTDRLDAQVIAEFARSHAHRLPTITISTELDASLRLLIGHDEDLRCDFNRTINRIRDLLTQHAPTLEQALGRRIIALGVLNALHRWGNPKSLGRARTATISTVIGVHNPRLAAKTADLMRRAAKEALDQPGLETAGELVSYLAGKAIELSLRRTRIGTELTGLARQHGDWELLNTIPGMGPKTSVRFIAEVGDIGRFPTGGHLASYAGLAPVNRQSGTGLNSVSKDRAGNHRLKNALFLAAFVAIRFDPQAAAHYDRLRARGKRHNAAVIAVARKRCDLIHAILTKRVPYRVPEEISLKAA